MRNKGNTDSDNYEVTTDMNQQCIQSHSNCHSVSYTEQLKPSFIGGANHYSICYTSSYRNRFSHRTFRKKDLSPGGTTYIKAVRAYRVVAAQRMQINTK
jgi:hypothetical protein